MRTYACRRCGYRVSGEFNHPEPPVCCAEPMRELDGIVVGGGEYAIWQDGKEVWHGSGRDAVEKLARCLSK